MKKLILAVFVLIFLGGCTLIQEETPDRSNRKDVSSSRMTSTPTPTATSTPTPEPTKASSGWTITYVTATPRPTATETPTPTPTMVPFEPSEEILAAEEFSCKVQIMDTVLKFPCRLKEITQIPGIVVEQSEYSSLNGYDPLNDLYGAESRNDLHVLFPDESEAWLQVENLGITSLPMGELYVTELVSESPCIFFPKGVSVGVHCSILKEWREHNELVTSSKVARYIYQEAECFIDHGTIDIGAEFDIYVNNTSYNIDEIKYTPTFYVDGAYMTEMINNHYPNDLKYTVPIALESGWRVGLIVQDDRQFVMQLENSYLFENPQEPEALLALLGRDMQYYHEDWGDWYYERETSEETNEKVIVQNSEAISTVINFWDYSDVKGKESVLINGKQYRAKGDEWKSYAETGTLIAGGNADLWLFSIEALDKGEIPEEVMRVFRKVVRTMAESAEVYEGR